MNHRARTRFKMDTEISDSAKKKTGPNDEQNCLGRPNASTGYWLCCLLPIAFLVSNYQQPKCSLHFEYKIMTISAIGMCMQSINFFVYLHFNVIGYLMKIVLVLMPGLMTSFLFRVMLHKSLNICLFWGLTITFAYQYVYIKTFRVFPKCFTNGEACILVQGLVLFILNCCLQLPLFIWNPPINEFEQINAIMMGALFCLFIFCWIMGNVKILRTPFSFYPLLLFLLMMICVIPVTNIMPIVITIKFIYNDNQKIYTILYYVCLVGLTVCTVQWQLGNSQKASTRIRKIFHILIVLVYIPGLIYQCTLLYIASGVALSLFIVMELIRLMNVPPLGEFLKSSFASFCDEKDAGPIAVTPFCLLIGCSLSFWIYPCPCSDDSHPNLLSHLSGILSIGIGDAAASVFGSKFGKHKWKDSLRSYEGTLAFILSQAVVIFILWNFNFISLTKYKMFSITAAVIITSIVEAKTDQIDNLVLPLIFFIIVNFA